MRTDSATRPNVPVRVRRTPRRIVVTDDITWAHDTPALANPDSYRGCENPF